MREKKRTKKKNFPHKKRVFAVVFGVGCSLETVTTVVSKSKGKQKRHCKRGEGTKSSSPHCCGLREGYERGRARGELNISF